MGIAAVRRRERDSIREKIHEATSTSRRERVLSRKERRACAVVPFFLSATMMWLIWVTFYFMCVQYVKKKIGGFPHLKQKIKERELTSNFFIYSIQDFRSASRAVIAWAAKSSCSTGRTPLYLDLALIFVRGESEKCLCATYFHLLQTRVASVQNWFVLAIG